jgi:hypothetical protein
MLNMLNFNISNISAHSWTLSQLTPATDVSALFYLTTPFQMILEWILGKCKSRDNSDDIALGYGLDDRGSRVQFPAGAGDFLFITASRTALGPTQPPIQWVPRALSLGVKRPGREIDHSPPSSAEVKECVELYFHCPIRLHGMVFN